ncbi:MAG: shikimate kinase [Chroococcidiopsidaceae cyanobacterium CP_BM_RX_35]|nr:shikimate kinase [Chroococcidiopsidaceae cyanobacterium CP_BM_RX_35]
MNNLLKGVNLYLIGMMGAGKTAVGRQLAMKLGYGFVDTDKLIEKAAEQSVKQLFANVGEAQFRQLESQVLAEVSTYTKLAVATGGGIILRRENWSYLHHGLVVWLDVPVAELCVRLETDTTRPLLQDEPREEKLSLLLEQRQAMYAQADLHVKSSNAETPEQVATRVLDLIPTVLKAPIHSKGGGAMR